MSESNKGLYVPGADGAFKFQGVAEPETRPVLTYESDTGNLLLNFNQIFMTHERRVGDIIVQSRKGVVVGIIVTSTPLGPEELRKLNEKEKIL